MPEFKKELYHKFMRISRLVFHRTHEELDKIDLYRGQPPLLFSLWEKDEQSRRELCDDLNRTPATITKMVGRLTKAGFVYSKQDPLDSRVSRVCLTDKGRDVEEEVKSIYASLNDEVFNGFSKDELVVINIFLDRMDSNIKNQREVKRGGCCE